MLHGCERCEGEAIKEIALCESCLIEFDKILNKRSEWISVKDRLPEPKQVVIACHNGRLTRSVSPMYYGISGKGEWHWWLDETMCIDTVTHWMPLPEPPKE